MFGGMVRGVSSPPEGSKILSFLFRPRLVCTSLLHLRSSWRDCLETRCAGRMVPLLVARRAEKVLVHPVGQTRGTP
jgi:hypothetical protein